MQTSLDCIPCFARQALEAARFVTDDPATHERVVRSVLRETAEMDLTQSPVVVAQSVHRLLRELTGDPDPYRAAKDRLNRMALDMLPGLSAGIESSADPFYTSLRLAITGNVIDLGVKGHVGEAEVREAVEATLHEPFHGDVEDFRRAVHEAESILYLADNAGEIVFDRLLVERLPQGRVTVAVRGGPVLNDATMADAEAAGLCERVEVIDNGADAPGTLLSDCSRAFRERFAAADLVIAKGQGNLEALSDEPADVYFLLKAKCAVIANLLGLPVGTHVARRSQPAAPIPERRAEPWRDGPQS